jgi:short-subunit dehydrogenase
VDDAFLRLTECVLLFFSNAGISTQGRSVDLEMNDVEAMIQLNVAAVSTLAHLYGKDMKDRRRGRILMVSSICGAIAGIPSVAVYSATKAFEKTLSISMAKELEEFGVGVTCLLPGAVSDTDFRKQNNAHDALCWKIPYYPTAPSHVAEVGVRAMLMGDSEVTPGLMNRAFLKVLMPIVPQRLHNWVAEIMWNPLNLPFIRAQQQSSAHSLPLVPSGDKIRPQPLVKFQASPRVLSLEDSLPEQPKAATETTKTMEDVKSNNTQLETVGEIHPARSDINYDSDNVARPNDTESTESSTTTYN